MSLYSKCEQKKTVRPEVEIECAWAGSDSGRNFWQLLLACPATGNVIQKLQSSLPSTILHTNMTGPLVIAFSLLAGCVGGIQVTAQKQSEGMPCRSHQQLAATRSPSHLSTKAIPRSWPGIHPSFLLEVESPESSSKVQE